MARAAKAYSRHQRRLAGDKSVGPSTPEEEISTKEPIIFKI
jgi:hypothetical protein